MEDLQDKIIELMDLFDDEVVTTADKIDRPQQALDREAYKDFMDRNPMAGGGMLVQPSADGSRPGYAGKAVEKNIRLSPSGNSYEVNIQRGPQIFNKSFNKDNYKNATEALNAAKKFRDQKLKIPFKTGIQEPKYGSGLSQEEYRKKYYEETYEYTKAGKLAKERETKLKNFIGKKKKIKSSVLRDFILNDLGYENFDANKIKKKFPNLVIEKDIKTGVKTEPLTKEEIRKIKDNFDLPEGEKWDFKKYKNGLNSEKYPNLVNQIRNRLADPKKYTIAANFSDPQGWMMLSMNRIYKNEKKNKVKFKDLTYQPKFNNRGIIVGFTDNTTAGGGNTYYGLKKNIREDGTEWRAHGDFSRVNKFLDIANGAKEEPSKLLTKILDDKGITKLMGDKSVLTLNDVLSHERFYSKLSETKPSELIKRQVVLHHTRQVGGDLAQAAATKDLQLLTGAVNANVNKLETIASKRKLNSNELTQLKNYGAKIVDFDGKVVGGGFLDPERQFKTIEKRAIDYAKSDQFNVKTVASYLERLGCGKAAGGRVFYNEGGFGLTECAEKGKLKLDKILTKGASNADDAILAKTILKAGEGLKSAFALRNIFGPAAIAATVAFEGGLIGYDMLTSGKTLREAFGDNLLNYALGKDYQIDPQEEAFKRYKGLGFSDQQVGRIKTALDAMNTINTGAQLAMSVGQQQEALQKSRGQPEEFMMDEDQFIADTAGQRAEQNLKDEQERLTAFNQNLEAVDRPGGMKKEDVLSEYFSSGKYAEDLNLVDEAQKAAIVQQKSSAGPKFVGSVLPKFEEGRIQTISENLPFGGANPAFNIPVNGKTYGEGLGAVTFIPGKTTGGLFGLAEGGRAGYRLGKVVKVKPSKARTDVKSIIDENIKLMKQMKETGEIDEISSDLNQVIKKALDEDLFDKKDRIVDSINISEAKKRKNLPYNMRVFEEPKNLDFYTAIQESNFRTKTGPYFDRIRRLKKAGGGLLKQAGDRSGPPPESGPNSQGLQGLLNRVKKV